MTSRLRMSACVAVVYAALALLLPGRDALAQQQFVRGQNVQPVYEGWERNPDGTYSLYFGYLNRNVEEMPDIPVGRNNAFSPGPADRGQPTRFYPRRQMILFKVQVPADFGEKQELIWTVTHNGRTDRAVGWLAAFYELDNTVLRAQRSGSQRMSTPEEVQAKPPTIEREGPADFTTPVNAPLSLSVLVRDDGLPGPSRRRRMPSTGSESADAVLRPLSRTSFPDTDMLKAANAAETGLAVTWLHYRGPGVVTFDPMTMPLDKTGGKATTRVRFSEPGEYVIRAVADDQIFTAPLSITVTVTPAAASQR